MSEHENLKAVQVTKSEADSDLAHRAIIAKGCIENFAHLQYKDTISDLIDQCEKKLNDALHAGKHEAFVMRIGAGIPHYQHNKLRYDAPLLSERQNQIIAALSSNKALTINVKQIDPERNEFWIALARKGS